MKNIWHSQHDSRIKLSQEEILKISQKINRKFPLNVTTTHPELVILPVDPYHLYIYWNLGTNLNSYWNLGEKTQNAINNDELETQLTLRIYSHPTHDSGKIKVWFDVPVYGSVTQQQVRLPSYEAAYSAAIGKRYPDNKFVIFAYSDIINVPLGKTSPYQPGKALNESVKNTQTGSQEKITTTNESPLKYTAAETTEVTIETSMHDKGMKGSTNPECEKGIEVSLTSKNEIVVPTDIDRQTVKLYDEELIDSLNKRNFSNNDSTIQPFYKKEYSEKLHLMCKNKSGKGIS